MRKKIYRFLNGILTAAMLAGTIGSLPARAAVDFGWEVVDGNWYWYENGIKQGTEGRGKEIYDPDSDAWYWLDAIDGGKKATNKDVYQESDAGVWADGDNKTGKWVHYDENGHMVKGWYTNENGTYFFDYIYGTMAKGYAVIDGELYYFDEITGIRGDCDWSTVNGWVVEDGMELWYEDGSRQGSEGRGKEIYDPDSDAWYWLDAVDGGKKAVNKDVYQESAAGDWAENADGTGKWVRYDENGHMVKGWSENENGRYYFDPIYGTMAKGIVTIDGKQYEFNRENGVLERKLTNGDTDSDDGGSEDNDNTGSVETKTDLSECTVILSQNKYTYDGTAKKPAVTVKSGNTTIDAAEYTVNYSDNINAGTAKVTVMAKSGSKTVSGNTGVTFTISKSKQNMTAAAGTNELTEGETTNVTVNGSYGSISYESSDTGVATVSGKGVIMAVKAGTADITVKAEGDSNHEAGSVKITIMVKEKANTDITDTKTDLSKCEVTLSESSYTYDGTEKKPTVTVKNGIATIDASEYTVSYSDNVNAGTAKVTVTAKSGSKTVIGSGSLTFTINKSKQNMTANVDTNELTEGETTNVTVNGSYGSISYESSDTGVATVSGEGVITAIKAGTVDITMKSEGDSNHEAGLAKITVTVKEKQEEEQDSVKYSGEEYGLTWTITDTGKLTVTGTCNTSEMIDWKAIGWATYKDEITDAVMDFSGAVNLDYLFYQYGNLENADLSKLDTSKATIMHSMFSYCEKLSSLDVSNFDTNKITDMSSMFYYCKNLADLNLSSFDTSNVTDMSSMFHYCYRLESLDLSNFDTSNVTDMSYMFRYCCYMVRLDISSFDTSNVTDMSMMFYPCSAMVKILGGSGWKIGENTLTDGMFSGCGVDDVTIREEGFDNSTEHSGEEYGLSWKITQDGKLTVTGICNTSEPVDWNTIGWAIYKNEITSAEMKFSGATNLDSLFYNYYNMKSADVSGLDTSMVTTMKRMFRDCEKLSELDVTGFNTENVTDMSMMFENCTELSDLDVSNFNTENVTNMYSMFWGCKAFSKLDLSVWDTGNVTDMSYMFWNCGSLTEILVGLKWKINTECNTHRMFENCGTDYVIRAKGEENGLIWEINGERVLTVTGTCNTSETIEWSTIGWAKYKDEITSVVTDFSGAVNLDYFLSGYENLEGADLTKLDTGTVTDMSSMFLESSKLTVILVGSKWQIRENVKTDSMFTNCGTDHVTVNTLEEIWETENIEDRGVEYGLFWKITDSGKLMVAGECNTPDTIDWKTIGWAKYAYYDIYEVVMGFSGATNLNSLFCDYCSLKSVDLSKLDTGKVTDMSNMFQFCYQLTALDLSSFDTSSVTDMSRMFYYCSSLTEIIVGTKWQVSSDCNTDSMITRCGTDHVTLKQ